MNILNVDVISTKRIQKIILNQSLIISSPLESIVDQIIVSNTFRNPKYTEAVKFGRSCFGMPSHIYTYTRQGCNLIVSRGFTCELMDILKDNNLEYELEDKRTCPQCEYPLLAGVTLRPYQQKAVDDATNRSQGVIVATTGAGKTIAGNRPYCTAR